MKKIQTPLVWAFYAHEPIQFYRRRAADLYSPLGGGRWIPAWYERIHSRETVRQAAEIGINLFYMHFYKGFGLKYEREEMLRTAEVVRYAHEFGIRVMGYCTIGTVYHETLADEFPEIMQNVKLSANGDYYYPGFEGGFNYRSFPCSNSTQYYEEYYPEILKFGLQEVGLDGFHFDNASACMHPCHCPVCVQTFRNWLKQNAGDPRQYSLASYDHVAIPCDSGSMDPIRVLWLRYLRETCKKVHSSVFRKVKQIKPEALVLFNGLGRMGTIDCESLDTPKEADFAFIEARNAIRINQDGYHITSVSGFKSTELAHVLPLNASWYRNEKSLRIPDSYEEIALYEAEHMVFGHACGTHWLMRTAKKGSTMVMDDPMHSETLRKIFHYFKEHSDLYAESRPVSSVKVLYSVNSRIVQHEGSYSQAIQEISEQLRQACVPWNFITPDSPAPDAEDTVVIPDQTVLSDTEAVNLRSWPCRILSCGDAGRLDDLTQEREEPVFRKTGLGDLPRQYKLDFPDGIIETSLMQDGSRLLHLINMKNSQVMDHLTMSLPFEADSVEVFSFEEGVAALMISASRVEVTQLRTMCTLKFSNKKEN